MRLTSWADQVVWTSSCRSTSEPRLQYEVVQPKAWNRQVLSSGAPYSTSLPALGVRQGEANSVVELLHLGFTCDFALTNEQSVWHRKNTNPWPSRVLSSQSLSNADIVYERPRSDAVRSSRLSAARTALILAAPQCLMPCIGLNDYWFWILWHGAYSRNGVYGYHRHSHTQSLPIRDLLVGAWTPSTSLSLRADARQASDSESAILGSGCRDF
jgi:hypothetical protein